MSSEKLYSPLKVGAITAANRIFMAPLTRLRSIEPGDIPTPLMAEYYRQRASAGLIISEATQISAQAKGYAGAPGIHSPEQIAAWKKITAGVHAENGHMAVQLWHTGRISHASLQPGGQAPVAPSALSAGTRTSLRDENGQAIRVETSMPRALELGEIPGIVNDFRQAIANAREAGFDLVELHSAHGYLLHQFLSPSSNHRTDQYGGSVENRARLVLEVVNAGIEEWGADRIGIRISPIGTFQNTDNGPNEEADALYLIEQLGKRGIAYLHMSEPDWAGGEPYTDAFREKVRARFHGPIIGAGAYTVEKAETLIGKGLIDAVAFGRDWIANPDLVARLQRKAAAILKQLFESVSHFEDIKMRLLHTMLRVGDLQRSIDFYTNVLGMKLLRTSENPEYKYSLAFVGYGPETEEAVIELTYNWGVDKYELGTAYGHIALSVDNAAEACEKIRQNGGNVTREAGPVKGGTTVIAFVEDPDGYKIELIEEKDAGRGLGN